MKRGFCKSCKLEWDEPNASALRNEAFQKAIDSFWREQLSKTGATSIELASVMFVFNRIAKLNSDNKRQMSAEFGRWLAGCSFIEK